MNLQLKDATDAEVTPRDSGSTVSYFFFITSGIFVAAFTLHGSSDPVLICEKSDVVRLDSGLLHLLTRP